MLVCAGKAQGKPKIAKKRRKKGKRKRRRKLITKEEGRKEQREKVTKCESSSPAKHAFSSLSASSSTAYFQDIK